jgi:hypothetical protein
VRSLLEDKRIRYTFTDGRAFVMLGDKKYDVIEADALRPTSAYSGNLYSIEYFTLLKKPPQAGRYSCDLAPHTTRHRYVPEGVFHTPCFNPGVHILMGARANRC